MTSDLCKAGVMIEHEDAKNRSNEAAADIEHIMERVITANLPTKYGDFLIHGFENRLNGEHHVALTLGDISNGEPVLVRVHSECLTGDVFGSAKCDCGDQFDAAMRAIAEEGRGIMIYLRQEGRGIGLINKLRAYSLQDQGMDTVEANVALGFPADMRDYTVGAEMLTSLGAKQLRLLTNNPDKVYSLEKFGLEITERVPIETKHKRASDAYMKTKKAKMGHILKTY